MQFHLLSNRSCRCQPEWSPVKSLIEKAVTQAKIKCDMQVLHRCAAVVLALPCCCHHFVTRGCCSTKFNRSKSETEANILKFVAVLIHRDILQKAL